MILACLYCNIYLIYMTRKRVARGLIVGLLFCVIIFSVWRAILNFGAESALDDYIGKVVTISGAIKGDPDLSDENGSIKLSKLILDEEEIPGTVFLSGRFGLELERGDRLSVTGKLSDGFGTYSASIFRPTIVALAKPEPGSITLKLRNAFAESVGEAMSAKEAKLGLAYLFGMRNGLDDDLLESLRLVGLTHLIVASGTHLGVIVEFFRKKFGKVSRFAGMLFSLIFVVIFGQLIGWTASISRAAIVSILAVIGWYYGRKLNPWRIILIAMVFTLIIDPMNIVDLGWLLSFASFIGILILQPAIIEFFYGQKELHVKTAKGARQITSAIVETIIMSVSAMLMCAPILLYYFGSFSLITIIANLLIMPTIPIAMGLTFLAGLFGMMPSFFVFDTLKWVIGRMASLLLDYHLVIIDFFSKQTSFIITIPKNNPLVFLLYIPIVFTITVYYIKKSKRKNEAKLRIYSNPERYLPFSRAL